VLDLVGRKSTIELHPGETCLLFMKVHLPRMSDSSEQTNAFDQDSLFTELESMVGTLEQEILHVEVRYKHSLIDDTNTVTARQICKIRRPQTQSRWSVGKVDEVKASQPGVHERLASYIAVHCDPAQALDLINHHLEPVVVANGPVRAICSDLEHRVQSAVLLVEKPSIVISDTSIDGEASLGTPQATHTPKLLREAATEYEKQINISPTPARSHSGSARDQSSSSPDAADSAREIWRHIRQSSQNTLQRLIESAPETLEQLASGDEVVRELRRRAVANKRSVGAETLRAWKWEGTKEEGTAPWM